MCLLFDIAIEPLAASLRNSELRGFQIPGHPENSVNLFADDTSIFMAAEDNFEQLQNILETWCIAAKAKFNKEKTEKIPIGSEEYWNKVLETRKTRQELAKKSPRKYT